MIWSLISGSVLPDFIKYTEFVWSFDNHIGVNQQIIKYLFMEKKDLNLKSAYNQRSLIDRG